VAVSGGNCGADSSGKYGDLESVWEREASGAEIVRRVEEPEAPSLAGPFNSSWSVPPQCENGMRFPLRDDFSNVKSALNKCRLVEFQF
jgi:hypothetical protein